MNYIYYFKQQVLSFIAFIFSGAIAYIIACKWGWREPVLLTPDYVLMLVSCSFTYLFIGPLIQKWIYSSNNI
jgi:hypothetical protein